MSGGGGIGSDIYALQNNLYLVASAGWNKPDSISAVGAVTLCNAATNNCTGQIVTAANSLTGSTAGDQIGMLITVLPNGDYVVTSPNWRNPASSNSFGASTLCRSASGGSCAGQTVSTGNSLTANGSQLGFGSISAGVTVLTNGNYIVRSPRWDNGSIVDAGAITIGSGTNGVSGALSAANSIVGTTAGNGTSNAQILINYTTDASGNKIFVGLPKDNRVVLTGTASAQNNTLTLRCKSQTWRTRPIAAS